MLLLFLSVNYLRIITELVYYVNVFIAQSF